MNVVESTQFRDCESGKESMDTASDMSGEQIPGVSVFGRCQMVSFKGRASISSGGKYYKRAGEDPCRGSNRGVAWNRVLSAKESSSRY